MKKILTRVLVVSMPWVVLVTCIYGSLFIALQQVLRQDANDPQIQLAEDFASIIASGTAPEDLLPKGTIPIESSLASYALVYDKDGVLLAGTGILHGEKPRVPLGVLQAAEGAYQNRVTWEPESGVRHALVVSKVRNAPLYIVTGRSLREVEERVRTLGKLLMLLWLVTVAGVGAALVAREILTQKPRALWRRVTYLLNRRLSTENA